MIKISDEDVFQYHEKPRPGKLEVSTSKPCLTQRDLSMAYTPGVARPCLAIEQDPELAYRYTGKGNLVAVVSNGTAVLGLGDIGAVAGKPVMEGKGVLFKRFAGVDVFDIELNTHDPDEIIRIVKALEPTFGGINLEDIKAPECFYIEESLKKIMDIPVFHDDQHGTAIISGAALVNALELVNKKIGDVKVVFAGAGAAGIACAEMYLRLGVSKANILFVDTVGVIWNGRAEKMNPYKQRFAADTKARTLADALKDADVFVGVSARDLVTPEMLKTMATDPIVFAMANPDPEIPYPVATATRQDVVMATGRSDYPNQVNNVLGFPFIFRGALDVRATAINDEMKVAAAHALAALAKEDVPETVLKAYGVNSMAFGREYLIPKPFDPRVLTWEAPAVAKAACETGVAKRPISDWDAYREQLERMLGPSRKVMHFVVRKARNDAPRRIVFPEGEQDAVIRAARDIVDQKIAMPVLLGKEADIRARASSLGIDQLEFEIVDVPNAERGPVYAEALYDLRKRKGVTLPAAHDLVKDPTIFALMMVQRGDADGFVGGMYKAYPETIRPALQIVGLKPGVSRVSAAHVLVLKDRLFFCADTMVNIEPTSEELAEIALLAADLARSFDTDPKVALLAFSSFGSVPHPISKRVARAVDLVREQAPSIVVDGEMHLDTAVVEEIVEKNYPHSRIKGDANVLVFPDLTSGNIGYKLVQRLGNADAIGPLLMGMRKPVNVLQHGMTVAEIVNVAAITAVTAEALRR
ncbi:MAG TPA: NADP-dependent malic enzyme [Vicinamibacterales bacterium]|nr:NADP-dependent malic enzyme [Vicinamibacterales bacterium]